MEFDDKNYPGIRTIREFTHEELLAAKYIKAKRKSIQKILFSFIYHKQKDGVF